MACRVALFGSWGGRARTVGQVGVCVGCSRTRAESGDRSPLLLGADVRGLGYGSSADAGPESVGTGVSVPTSDEPVGDRSPGSVPWGRSRSPVSVPMLTPVPVQVTSVPVALHFPCSHRPRDLRLHRDRSPGPMGALEPGPRPPIEFRSPVPKFGLRVGPRSPTGCRCGGPRMVPARWGPVPALGPRLLGPRPRSRSWSPESVLCPRVRSRHHSGSPGESSSEVRRPWSADRCRVRWAGGVVGRGRRG